MSLDALVASSPLAGFGDLTEELHLRAALAGRRNGERRGWKSLVAELDHTARGVAAAAMAAGVAAELGGRTYATSTFGLRRIDDIDVPAEPGARRRAPVFRLLVVGPWAVLGTMEIRPDAPVRWFSPAGSEIAITGVLRDPRHPPLPHEGAERDMLREAAGRALDAFAALHGLQPAPA